MYKRNFTAFGNLSAGEYQRKDLSVEKSNFRISSMVEKFI